MTNMRLLQYRIIAGLIFIRTSPCATVCQAPEKVRLLMIFTPFSRAFLLHRPSRYIVANMSLYL